MMSFSLESTAWSLLALVAGIVGWVATHLVGKPLLAYRALRAEIARCLILYGNVPSFVETLELPPSRGSEARTKYRELASDLVACATTILWYPAWSFVRLLPTRKALEEAKANLIGLSNSVGVPNQGLEISRRVDTIRRLLRITYS